VPKPLWHRPALNAVNQARIIKPCVTFLEQPECGRPLQHFDTLLLAPQGTLLLAPQGTLLLAAFKRYVGFHRLAGFPAADPRQRALVYHA
jgi:hypothetical protein